MQKLAGALLPALTPSRLLHVAKTAAAATLAWYAGHLVPGEANAYAYYAPLGALVASVPTVAGSVRSSVQVVVGVLLGVLASGALASGALSSGALASGAEPSLLLVDHGDANGMRVVTVDASGAPN